MRKSLLVPAGILAVFVAASCLQAQDSDPDALFNQGNSAMRSGDFVSAADAYRRVTELRPAFPEGFFSLGLALEQSHQYADAVTALRKARTLKPTLKGVNL